jgi:hypothetical protein
LKKRYVFLIAGLFFALPVFLFAQTSGTAAELDAVLASSAVTCAQAARFVFGFAEDAGAGGNAAFEQAKAKGWLPEKAGPDDPVTLGTLSFLIMNAFHLKGGLMYALLPGPRYAFRTMVSRAFIQGAADPAMTVSGERFLLILGNAAPFTEGEQ